MDSAKYQGRSMDIVVGTQGFEEKESWCMQHVSFRGLLAIPFGERMEPHVFCARFPAPGSSTTAGTSSRRARTTDDGIKKILEKLPCLTEAEVSEYSRERCPRPVAEKVKGGAEGDSEKLPLP